MRVLVCPTAFKGTLGAAAAAAALARGARSALPDADVREMPLSDGGPGLLDALLAADPDSTVETVEVTGPLGGTVPARILWSGSEPPGDGARDEEPAARAGEAAILESADACGLARVPAGGEDALQAHTLGVGELIREALARGAARLVVGLGGSATSDGGTGMARVFGWRFLDESRRELAPGGGALTGLDHIVRGWRPSVPVTGLADVETPLNGAAGAARTFGPQKGASAREVERLVEGLERLSDRLAADLGADGVGDVPGSGAAGGLGAGLVAFLGAELVGGSGWVLERVGFDGALAGADLVLTGEGAWDASSSAGKIVGRVLERTRSAGTRAILVCGSVEGDPGPGVRTAYGDGRRLEPDDLADLAAREVRAAAGS